MSNTTAAVATSAPSTSATNIQSRTALSETQMEAMRVLIKKDNASFADIMTQLWKYVLNDDHAFDEGKTMISCSAHAIPKAQSEQILLWMLEAAGPSGAASTGLNYINISPSSY